jgi:hypothetical protein
MTTDSKSKVGTEKERGQVRKFLFKNPLPFAQITIGVSARPRRTAAAAKNPTPGGRHGKRGETWNLLG